MEAFYFTPENYKIKADGKTEGTARNAPTFRNRKFGKDVAVFEVTLKPHSFKGFTF